MENAITTRAAHSLAPLGTLSPTLESAVRSITHAVVDGHFTKPADPSAAVVDIAKATLPEVIASCAPVHPEVLRNWFSRLVDALPIGGAKDDRNRVRNAIGALAETCGEFPAECFTAETMKITLQRCKFFPTGAELFEILDPINQRVKARAGAIKELANFKPKQEEVWNGPKTDEERLEMARKFEGLAREMAAKSAAEKGEKPQLKPIHASKLQLALSAQAQGQKLSDMRPDLRAALEAHLASQETHA